MTIASRILACGAALLVLGVTRVRAQSYHVAKTFVLGGDGGWDYVALDTVGHRLFIARQDRVMVVDPAAGKVLAEIPGLNRVHGIAFAYETGHGFATSGADSAVTMFDLASLRVLGHTTVAPDDAPTGLAIDRAHPRLFSGCRNQLMAISDATTGKLVATVPIGQGVDACRFDAGTGLAFASNGDGTLTVVHEDTPDKFTVVGNVPTKRGARTMELDEKSHRLFTVTADFGPPPAPTAERPRPRPSILPGTFALLVLDP